MKSLVCIFVLFCMMRCNHDDDLHKKILFINNANYKVWVAKGACYSDTITDIPGYIDIMPNSSGILAEPIGYEELANESPDKEILIVVKRADPFIFDRKYVLGIDSLNKLGWTLNYP